MYNVIMVIANFNFWIFLVFQAFLNWYTVKQNYDFLEQLYFLLSFGSGMPQTAKNREHFNFPISSTFFNCYLNKTF